MTTKQAKFIRDYPILQDLLVDSDHVDVKQIESDVPMRLFIAGMFSYMPIWLKALYGIRWGFVRLLGMTQGGLPEEVTLSPEKVSFVPGEQVAFFEVERAKEHHYWVAAAADKHLIAYLALVAEPISSNRTRYHLLTIVDYKHWTGPVYFNIIRPFHHLVVAAMMRSASKSSETYQPV